MYYERGTLINKKNILFKQSNKLDSRIHGHPVILPIDFGFEDSYLYFFTLSSQIEHYIKEPERYFLLKKTRGSGLRTNSIVDLKYVYKCEFFNTIPTGIIPKNLNYEIIKKFYKYNNVVVDEDCREFLGLVEQVQK